MSQSQWEARVDGNQANLRSESMAADLCLGAIIAGVNTLMGIGLIIAFA